MLFFPFAPLPIVVKFSLLFAVLMILFPANTRAALSSLNGTLRGVFGYRAPGAFDWNDCFAAAPAGWLKTWFSWS